MIHENQTPAYLRGMPLDVEPVEDGGTSDEAAQPAVDHKLCGLILIGGQYDHTREQFFAAVGRALRAGDLHRAGAPRN